MADVEVLNWLVGCGTVVTGWFGRTLWENDKAIKKDLEELREELHKEYVSKEDIDKRLERIDRTLELIWSKMKQR